VCSRKSENALAISRRLTVLAGAIFLLPLAFAQPQQSSPSSASAALNNPATEKKIDALLRQMTLEEKVGQLVQYSAGQPTGPGTGRTDYNDMIQKGQVGALFNITTAHDVNGFQHIAVEKSRLKIPIIFGQDVIHGFRTEFPVPLALAATWDPDLVQRTARLAAREASANGIRWVFSPMLDISRDARWGRIVESNGEDPYLDSALAVAYVHGYQGERLDAPDSVAACPKHFVGYGASEAGRDYNSTEISEHTLREFYLPPFHAAIEAGAVTIMSSFNSLNGVPASANPFTLKEILRKEWGFRGIADSDWTSIGELIPHGIANDPAAAARKAFLAGVDMDMVSSFYHDTLVGLVRSGQVPEANVDEAVRHVLRVKFALGLFEHPFAPEAQQPQATLPAESLSLAREAAERSFVLLKNSAANGGVPPLPLSDSVKNIALIGPLADDAADMLGSWSGPQNRPEDVVTLRAALTQKLGADRVHYALGSEITKASDNQINEAVKIAQQSDFVLLALGENGPEMTGEAASRAHLGLPGRQQQLLEAIVATGKPVVLILFSGRPLTLPWAFEHVPAVLAAWFPGIQAGPALVHTLYGESSPTGKLPLSWQRAVGQEPLYYNALDTGRPAGAADLTKPPTDITNKYVSRYIDEQNSPQFAFGHGLTYTTFRYGAPQLSTTRLSAKSLNDGLRSAKQTSPGATVTAEITNTGSRPAEETAQLYIRLEGTSTAQPVRALKGFKRIRLAAGETQRVTFDLTPDVLALWDIQNKYVVEPARVTVWICPDSAQGSGATLEITQ
jgi:beta-glucosidase